MPISPIRTVSSKVWGPSLDGVDDYVDCGSNPILAITDEITICIWAKSNTVPEHEVLITSRDTNWRNGYELDYTAGYLRFVRCNETDIDYITVSPTWDPTELTFYTAKYDGQYLYLYVNGKQVGKKSATITSISPALPLIIGTSSVKRDPYWWNGIIALVHLYNRALTDDEILGNYRGYVTTDGLVLWLWANELLANEDVWRDRSGYGNHGTIYGAVWTETPIIEFAKPTRLIAQTRLISPTR